MPFFTSPTSYRLNGGIVPPPVQARALAMTDMTSGCSAWLAGVLPTAAPHSSHPAFGHLVLLVFEAVLEVVCVSLPGYIVARQGMFDAEAQKFVANLNVQLFTPCLIFTKLASQLSAEKLGDLAVIPFIFVVQTLVSYLCAILVARLFKFKKRARNFVIAMGVFGNSNSLPISLVISLSKTLKGLHWDRIPGDNDDEVAARGILYLLIFQQLGQLVRWSWGYNVLLKPASAYSEEEGGMPNSAIEAGEYHDESEEERLLLDDSDSDSDEEEHLGRSSRLKPSLSVPQSEYESGILTPSTYVHESSSSSQDGDIEPAMRASSTHTLVSPTNGTIVKAGPGKLAGYNHYRADSAGHITTFPVPGQDAESEQIAKGPKDWPKKVKHTIGQCAKVMGHTISASFKTAFQALPMPLRNILGYIFSIFASFLKGLWSFMNPPLWAMLVAIVVASIPPLQDLFFRPGTFVNNSVTHAVSQSGGVAVPLILVVLGANLARNTLPKEDIRSMEDPKTERNLLIACLVSRMLLPTIVMAPFLAIVAKQVPVSILDDPIFIIVCFLLTGAPSALQLAQICQINNVFMGAMSKLLFQSYVIWILPSTLVLVMLALETVEWAAT